jgi:hypothetical protein
VSVSNNTTITNAKKIEHRRIHRGIKNWLLPEKAGRE